MKLKKIYCKHFPFKGYIACTVFPFVFIREDKKEKFTLITERHENIHAVQQLETLWLPFFILYGLEYAVKLLLYGTDHKKAYRNISFERETYSMQDVEGYENVRKHFAWVRRIFTIE